ncbi:MAG TPA: TetR/AcrR family transcriptional regulator [Chloroflexota bacterium]|nr:TetR/AcrR family transcriptional regulator [Chloroflexota bacterium]
MRTRPRANAVHERILERGLELASERGVTGVTLGDLAQRAQLSKSGLFAHFRSKEELQIELLEVAEARITRQVVEPAMQAPSGVPRLRELMRRWLGWWARTGLPGGCPLYGAAFELDDAPGPVRDHLVERHRVWMEVLARLVREAIDHGELAPDIDVEDFVWQLIGIYLAHHVSHRLTGDPQAHQRGMASFEALVAAGAADRNPAARPPGQHAEGRTAR